MLKNKVAVITNASRGMGKAIALEFAEQGALVVTNVNEMSEEISCLKNQIEQKGGLIYQCDISSYEQCEKFLKSVIRTYGRLDILVNNGGITKDRRLLKMTEEDFDSVIQVNLKGTFNCIRFVSRQMMRQRYGRIINITSVVGICGNAGQINYAASQAGIIGITKAAAKEFAQKGITVNAIAPGFIQTEVTEVLSEKVKGMIAEQIPMHKFGKLEDVAKTAIFLASEETGYITGQVIQVDGGMAM